MRYGMTVASPKAANERGVANGCLGSVVAYCNNQGRRMLYRSDELVVGRQAIRRPEGIASSAVRMRSRR